VERRAHKWGRNTREQLHVTGRSFPILPCYAPPSFLAGPWMQCCPSISTMRKGAAADPSLLAIHTLHHHP
jgi:hypothetical protein